MAEMNGWDACAGSAAKAGTAGACILCKDERVFGAPAPPPPPSSGPDDAGSPRRSVDKPARSVLIVDDDTDFRDSLGAVLVSDGYDVSQARDGIDALEQLSRGPPPSVVVVDLNMPRMNGWQLMTAIRSDERLAHLNIVVMTAAGLRPGAIGETPVFNKDIATLVNLKQVVEDLLAKRAAPTS